jgi:hypothetical protein
MNERITHISVEDAEEYVSGSWRQIALAKRLGVPQALGLSVEDWVTARLGGYIKLSIPDRREAVEELAADGLSTREIGDVLGVDQSTVVRDANASSEQGNSQEISAAEDQPDAFASPGDGARQAEESERNQREVIIRIMEEAYRCTRTPSARGAGQLLPPHNSGLS